MSERWGFKSAESKHDRTDDREEIERLSAEFKKAGGMVEQCQKQYTRAEYLVKMAEDEANGVKQVTGKYSNTTISHKKYGSF